MEEAPHYKLITLLSLPTLPALLTLLQSKRAILPIDTSNMKVETYVRVSAPPWKDRYGTYKSSFTNANKKDETKMSPHI